MQRTVRFPREPTLAQAAAILAGMERYLHNLGADVARDAGGIRFRFGAPWRPDVLRALGSLAIVSSGNVSAIATGGPRRICYVLRFRALWGLCVVLTLIAVAVGWRQSREALISSVVAIWLLGYLIPSFVVLTRFRRSIQGVAHDVMKAVRHPPDSPVVSR